MSLNPNLVRVLGKNFIYPCVFKYNAIMPNTHAGHIYLPCKDDCTIQVDYRFRHISQTHKNSLHTEVDNIKSFKNNEELSILLDKLCEDNMIYLYGTNFTYDFSKYDIHEILEVLSMYKIIYLNNGSSDLRHSEIFLHLLCHTKFIEIWISWTTKNDTLAVKFWLQIDNGIKYYEKIEELMIDLDDLKIEEAFIRGKTVKVEFSPM